MYLKESKQIGIEQWASHKMPSYIYEGRVRVYVCRRDGAYESCEPTGGISDRALMNERYISYYTPGSRRDESGTWSGMSARKDPRLRRGRITIWRYLRVT